MPNLKVRDGSRDYIHQIEGEILNIGRSSTNTIEISDAKASKEHCRVERVGNRWKVVDLESKNGTRVNGDFCNKAWLEHGDMIQIGKAELRFGVEGGGAGAVQSARSRPAAARAASRAPSRGPSRPAPPRRSSHEREHEYDYEDDIPARRRYGKSANDKLVIVGLVLLGAVLIFIIAAKTASSLQKDEHNMAVIKNAEKLMSQDQWREALEYMQKHADPEGNSYSEVVKRMESLQSRIPDFYKQRDEQQAKSLLSKLARKVKAYNAGKMRALPEDILKMVGELKNKYPGTEATKLAKEDYRAWFAGRVPQRASELMRSSPQLLKDWQEAEDRSYEYVKQWKFREARETIEIFLTAREAVLDESDLEHYRGKVKQALERIDLQADGIYRARQRVAWNLEKNKRYDQAIKVYQEVIDKFGIDLYQRKAQEEINKLKAKKG